MKIKPEYKGLKIFLQKQRLTINTDLIPEIYLPLVLKSYPHIFEQETPKKLNQDVIPEHDTIITTDNNTTDNN